MGRHGFMVIVMIGLSVPLYFTMNTMMTTFSNPRINLKDGTSMGTNNWIMTINTTINKVNENCSIIEITSNVTYLENVLMPQKISGGFGFVIDNTSTGFYWTPYLYAPTQATEVNYHQVKGSTITNYAITINKTVNSTKTDFVFNTNKTADYTFRILINQDLQILTGLLAVNCDTGLNVSLKPSSWYVTGFFNPYTSNENPTNTDNWALTTTTSIKQLEPNITKWTVNQTISYYDTIKVSNWVFGNYYKISSNTTDLFTYITPQLNYNNFTINKSTEINSIDFIFFSKNQNVSNYNGFKVNVTNGGIFQFEVSFNPNLPSYTGMLNINLVPFEITIQPRSFNTSGELTNIISTNSHWTESVGYVLPLSSVFALLILLEVRKHKTKK